MELKIKKELRTTESGQPEFSNKFIEVTYDMDHRKATYANPYVNTYIHELKIFAKGQFPSGDTPDHSMARNGLMSFLYSDIIHELHLLANDISPRNTDALKRIRQMQHDLSTWE
jgi:hypothetical protein